MAAANGLAKTEIHTRAVNVIAHEFGKFSALVCIPLKGASLDWDIWKITNASNLVVANIFTRTCLLQSKFINKRDVLSAPCANNAFIKRGKGAIRATDFVIFVEGATEAREIFDVPAWALK